MNLNLFRVLSPAEQEAQRQYAELEQWQAACLALGATPAQLVAYERAAQTYARTTLYPNSAIVTQARQAAKEALMRGEPMPQDIAATVQQMWGRELATKLGMI